VRADDPSDLHRRFARVQHHLVGAQQKLPANNSSSWRLLLIRPPDLVTPLWAVTPWAVTPWAVTPSTHFLIQPL
jgi:hypothetical protein